jgi:hypothetical protein
VDPDTPVLEDDWPFVYLRERAVPFEYLIAMALMAIASLGLVRAFGGRAWTGPDALHFASLGAAFLLLETRGLTVLALLLGSTWGVTCAVFAGILLMAFAATVAASRVRQKDDQQQRRVVLGLYASLIPSLALDFCVTTGELATLPLVLRVALGAVLVSLPLFAGGVIFATSLARSGEADRALAANLVGAMAGGLMEYVAMITGFRMLVLLAGALYGLALLGFLRSSTVVRSSHGTG